MSKDNQPNTPCTKCSGEGYVTLMGGVRMTCSRCNGTGLAESKEPRNRPYNGQPHTDQGERGKTLVSGLTMRDVVDCLKRAFALSTHHLNPKEYAIADKGGLDFSLYDLDLSDFDPGAVGQNLTCEIERMMGIFPNVPGLEEAPQALSSAKASGNDKSLDAIAEITKNLVAGKPYAQATPSNTKPCEYCGGVGVHGKQEGSDTPCPNDTKPQDRSYQVHIGHCGPRSCKYGEADCPVAEGEPNQSEALDKVISFLAKEVVAVTEAGRKTTESVEYCLLVLAQEIKALKSASRNKEGDV